MGQQKVLWFSLKKQLCNTVGQDQVLLERVKLVNHESQEIYISLDNKVVAGATAGLVKFLKQ